MFRDVITKLIALVGIVLFLVLGWLYITPYRLYVVFRTRENIYEMDNISKEDFRVFAASRLGRYVEVEDFYINSDEVSKTGLVAIRCEKPELGALVDLNSISVVSSEITYNDFCKEDAVEDYIPQVSELIRFEDGSVQTMGEQALKVDYQVDRKKANITLDVEGIYDHYKESFSMITADSITTDTKISTKKTLTSDRLNLELHYSDGSSKKLDKELVKCDPIKQPKKGYNDLTCYYNDKAYQVRVKAYEPVDKRPKVTFADYGTFILEYSKPYEVAGVSRLNTWVGVRHFNNHRETYYSMHSPGGFGTNLYIPGKHVAEDGTVRDQDGYICLAADYRFCRPYQVVLTTLGPGKIYDTGCVYGTVDVYVDWPD